MNQVRDVITSYSIHYTKLYELLTDNKEIELSISKENIEKSFMLDYIKCPFFILSYKDIDNEITIEDSFEISTEEATLDLECQATCGLNLNS